MLTRRTEFVLLLSLIVLTCAMVCVARTWSALLTTLCNVNRLPMGSVAAAR